MRRLEDRVTLPEFIERVGLEGLEVRLGHPSDFLSEIAGAISSQMYKMMEAGHPFKAIVDPLSSIRYIKALNEAQGVNVYVSVKTGKPVGAVGFSVVPVWWSKGNKPLLVEEFVISLDNSIQGFGRLAVKRLEYIASLFDCQLIMSGNLLGTTQKQTENLYMKKSGFQLNYQHFVKVVN